MEEFCFKHTGLPIPDLRFRYEIDVPNSVVRIDLDGHLDSALLIDFARRFLEEENGIRVIDNKSFETIGPAHIEARFDIEMKLAGQLFDIKIVQLAAWGQRSCAAPVFTISMQKKK